VMDMTENDSDWRRQIADIYEGVIVWYIDLDL